MGLSALALLGRFLLCVLLLLVGSTAQADRPDTANSSEPFRFLPSDVIESYDSPAGTFRIFYTRDGKNAVPLADSNADGIPDRIAKLALLYEQVAVFYQNRGFRAVLSDENNAGPHGGDGRFDIYLLDFGKSADGAYRRESCDVQERCSGFIVQENDFKGYGYPSLDYGDRVLASHEFFHAVQAAYDNSETTIFSEGTAVWATEQFDASLADLEGFVAGYLDRPDRSLYLPQAGPVDPFSYGASIFFQFLSERFSSTIVEELWTASDGDSDWFTALDPILADHGSSFASAFVEFATWNLATAARADPPSSYAGGAAYPLVKVTAVALPLDNPAQRIFPSATVYLGTAPAGRSRLAAELVFPDAPDGVDSTQLRLRVALRTGNQIAAPKESTDGKTLAIDVGSAEEAIFMLVNTKTSGESIRPALCIGTEAEVAACATPYRPDQPITTPPVNSGGCNAAPRGNLDGAALLIGLVMMALRFRNKRQSS